MKFKQDPDENNKELKRLQFYGAGPKMAGYNIDKKEEDQLEGKSCSSSESDPVSQVCLSHYAICSINCIHRQILWFYAIPNL